MTNDATYEEDGLIHVRQPEIPEEGWFFKTSMRIIAGDDEQLYQALIRL